MLLEKSCGAIVYSRENDTLRFVLVMEMSGSYSFPKGHMEAGESETDTAKREIKEEIGLDLVLDTSFRRSERYKLSEKPGTEKEVVYFLADLAGQTPKRVRPEEILEIRLFTYEEALAAFYYENKKDLLREAYSYLCKKP